MVSDSRFTTTIMNAAPRRAPDWDEFQPGGGSPYNDSGQQQVVEASRELNGQDLSYGHRHALRRGDQAYPPRDGKPSQELQGESCQHITGMGGFSNVCRMVSTGTRRNR